jgi:hypothetical protein
VVERGGGMRCGRGEADRASIEGETDRIRIGGFSKVAPYSNFDKILRQ